MVGLIERITKRWGRGQAERWVVSKAATLPQSRQIVDPFEELYRLGRVIEPPYDPLRLLLLAETNEIHAAALAAVATDAAGRGWYFEADDDDADADVRDAAEARLDDLNPQMTFSELLYQVAFELRAVGWAAWEVVRGEDGQIGAVYPMPAHTVRLTKDPDVFIQIRGARTRYFKRFGLEAVVDGATGEYREDTDDPATELIFFARYNARTRYGVPDWIACVPAIAEYNAIRDYSIAWFESSGTVGRAVWLQTDSQAEAQQYVDYITQTLQNAVGRYHSTVVLGLPKSVNLNVEQLNAESREGSFLRRREDLIKAILMAHQVPPYRIGWAVMGSLGGSTASEMMDAYRHGVIEPLQTVLEDRLNKTLFGPQGLGLTAQGWRWRLEDLDDKETETELKIAIQGVQNAILSPNQARQRLGYEPEDDPAMDAYYLQGKPIAEPAAKTVEALIKDLRDALAVVMPHGAASAPARNGVVAAKPPAVGS